ncbi:MAG: hypothetical protein HKP41_09140 [Desulfobacterales bacterium]|nr:hypothetical protein [Deltaproteobacteria bacterium]NNK94499.1 hypothetical protein [Desulfobacterales bacterium]
MGKDKLSELREEWYSQPDKSPETEEEIIDDELLELQVLFKSRGVTVAGEGSVRISDDKKDSNKKKQ